MGKRGEEVEAVLLEQARQAIGKLLDEFGDASTMRLSEMEKAVGEMGQSLMEASLQQLVELEHSLPEKVGCERCGKRMYRRGKRQRRVVTTRGEVAIERQYYVCPACGAGCFPPG
jgi:hypothetical protein